MKKNQIDLGFCLCQTNDAGETWDLIINTNKLSEWSLIEIQARLRDAFRLGMEYKAKEIRDCLYVKETITLK